MSTEEYLRDFVMGTLGAKTLLLGYDNRIGHDGGSPDQIQAVAEGLGMEVIRTDRLDLPGEMTVSSTKIRHALEAGDVALASRMLGYRYSLLGVVVAGNHLGRKIGFPTANMQLYEPLKLIPGNGVYHVEVETLGERHYGMCNIGVRPTVGQGNAKSVEVNIFDFDQDIYGLDIRITFLEKIRDERRFDSLEALAAQLALDRDRCLRANE
jgi:riboflavin kinase/FMN adenylyltransferase